MHRLAALFTLVLWLAFGAPSPLATAQPGDIRETRARAVIEALANNPSNFERVAQENYAPALLARRTPEERAQFARAIGNDFAGMRVEQISGDAATLTINVRAASGPLAGTFVFSFAEGADQRIARIDVQAEAGGGGPRHGGPGAGGPRVPPPQVDASMNATQMSAAIDTWLAPYIAHDDFAGVVMVAREGRPFLTRAYGLADRERNRAATETTRYNIASIGKKFTQTAIARLIQEGRLTRNSTIGELLPDYPNREAHSATIDQLVGMRGGISDFFGEDFSTQPKSRFNSNHAYYEYVSRLPQRFAPGSQNEYCNGCYVILGEIVERLSGVRFEDYVQRVVFTPAGMSRSGYFNAASLPEGTAFPYVRSAGPGSAYRNTQDHHGIAGSGAGGAYSTVGDLLAFDNALRDGRLLNPEMTAWVLGGQPTTERNHAALGVAGGGGGASNILVSDGHWTVIVTGNVPELPERIGQALGRQLN